MFGRITVLAVALDARANPDGNPSVISQIAASVFGGSSVLFYLFQAATTGNPLHPAAAARPGSAGP
jgi:hypothetical protein